MIARDCIPRRNLVNFGSKVKPAEDNGCWEWVGAISGNGYGTFHLMGRNVGAHRASYIIFVGDIPRGKSVLHSCDNRRCVNPRHLSVGTAKENTRQMVDRGRCNPSKGENNYNCKLSDDEVAMIREATGKYADIAKKFGCTPQYVGALKRGEWRKEQS